MAYKVLPDDDYISISLREGVDAFRLQQENKFAALNPGQTIKESKKTADVLSTTASGVVNKPAVGSYEWKMQLQQSGRTPIAPPNAGSYNPQGTGSFRGGLDAGRNIGTQTPGKFDPNAYSAPRIGEFESNSANLLQSKNTGTFSQTNLDKWQEFYTSPNGSMPGIDKYVQQYTDVYEDSLIGLFGMERAYNQQTGQYEYAQKNWTNAYGEVTATKIPAALLSTIGYERIDSQWLEENAAQLAGMQRDEIAALWLASLGYEFASDGNYMQYNPNSGELGGDGSSGGSGGSGGRRYGGGGGGSGSRSFYNNAVSGLINWRGVGYA